MVSIRESAQATQTGPCASAITFEGIGRTGGQLESTAEAAAGERELRWLSIESPDETKTVDAVERYRLGVGTRPPVQVLLRANPPVEPDTGPGLAVEDASSKFDSSATENITPAQTALFAPEGICTRSVHVHMDSTLAGSEECADAGVCAGSLVPTLAPFLSEIDTIDFGGGFTTSDSGGPAPANVRAALGHALTTAGSVLLSRTAIEPGRYPIAGAGWILARVLHIHRRRSRQQVVIDARMTELIRSARYGARHPVDVRTTTDVEDALATDMEGPICESTDTLGCHNLLRIAPGDLVVIAHSGAHPASFSSRHNCRPQPPEILFEPDGPLTPRSHAHVPRCFHPGASSPTKAPAEFLRFSYMHGYTMALNPRRHNPLSTVSAANTHRPRGCAPALDSRSHNDSVGT